MTMDTNEQIARRKARKLAAQRRLEPLTPEDMDLDDPRPSRYAPYDDGWYDPRRENAWERRRDALAEEY